MSVVSSLTEYLESLTPEQITSDLEELAAAGLTLLGQPQLAALAAGLGAVAIAVEKAVQSPSPAAVMAAEVTTADAGADQAEALRFK